VYLGSVYKAHSSNSKHWSEQGIKQNVPCLLQHAFLLSKRINDSQDDFLFQNASMEVKWVANAFMLTLDLYLVK